MKTDVGTLQQEYQSVVNIAHRFAGALSEQIAHLLSDNQIPLGAGIEHRVKTWNSIAEKLERKRVTLSQIADFADLIGLRLMLLFGRDVEKTCDLICTTFNVLEREDTRDRLMEDQFGYQSLHLIITPPETWLKIPSLKGFAEFKAEIQVRTLAQHIWAASSHVLQYKQENGVPLPVRRSIHRVSALLETVDLEFERVLQDRENYLHTVSEPSDDDVLNVDLLAQILNQTLPPANKDDQEQYGELLVDLVHFGIRTVGDIRRLFASTLSKILVEDRDKAEMAMRMTGGHPGTTAARTERGVFFTHVGLTRVALAATVGETEWQGYATKRFAAQQAAVDKTPNKPSGREG